MNPERWERLKEIFDAALEYAPDRRTQFVRQACAGDESLFAEVERMLARNAESPDFLESPALQAEAQDLARDLEARGLNSDRSLSSSAPAGRAPGRHSPPSTRPPWWMYCLAAVFLADCLIRTYCIVLGPGGFDFRLKAEGDRSIVTIAPPGSTAERIGIRPGDTIIALDGHTIRRFSDWRGIWSNLETGRSYSLYIERAGKRLPVAYTMERVKIIESRRARILALWQIDGLLLLFTAFLIGFSRPYDFLARMGALALASLSIGIYYTTLPYGYTAIWRDLPRGLAELLWISNACAYLVGAIVLTFFVLFPHPLFRGRWPWVIIWLPTLCFVPAHFHTTFLMVYRPQQFYGNLLPDDLLVVAFRLEGMYYLAAVVALAINYFRITDRNGRRRLRVLLIGGGAAVLPGAARLLIWRFQPLAAVYRWLNSGAPDFFLTLIFVLFPICFAYSILRHRLLDIHVIIRQGIRYAVTRRALLSWVPILGVILVIDLLVHGDQPLISIVTARGWIYAGMGVVAVGLHSQRRRWGEAIDRRFFREQYDARRLLREVAAEAGRARSLAQIAAGVVARIDAALHPEFAAIMLRSSGETDFRPLATSPSDKAPLPLPAESGVISMLRSLDGPLEVVPGKLGRLERQLPVHEIDLLCLSRIDLFVPISMTLEPGEALLALGAKRSEEPYTRDDQDLLSAIAANLGLLLERPEAPQASPREEFEECPQCGACYDSGAGRCAQEGAVPTPVHMPRTLAGRYHLERRRGRGGMGTVYEATDRALGRRVAVKILREDRLYSAEAAQRFQREARAAAGFSHPNVVTVYDYGVEGGTRAFLVMELLEGISLRDELQARKLLDPARTVRIFRGLCNAVEAAHNRQLIHRDLKPENIFLVRSGNGGSEVVKVLDFGIAKFLPGSGEGSETRTIGETDAGILVGTPGYMSPEQLLGETPDVSWDLWALAVTAYETLTGVLPFTASSGERWRQSVLAGAYTPLSRHLNHPTVAWEQFFAHSLAADRARRPQSAAEFLHVMEEACTGGCNLAYA